ncbi:MAG: serine/threonine protein kinase [Actinomycetota bacterium]|nr:serine/threonine protein kinase [Actinomycetota bacterium]
MVQHSDPRRVANRYLLVSILGRGGMAVVWRGEDLLLRRDVAIKEVSLPDGVAPSERDTIRSRVLREARAAASLNHSGAVMIFDVVDHEGQTFIVMELLDGRTLVELVAADGPLTPARTARLGLSVLGALETAHAKGIIHRDVKPANIMVMPDGRSKLSDFGIATLQDDTRITSTGLVLGSPAFMAPEQASGAPSAPESDLWGLGATLYYALEGSAPFERPGVIPTLAAIINEDPRPTERAGPLGPLVEGLLAKSPGERPGPTEIRAALGRAAGSEGNDVTGRTQRRGTTVPMDAGHFKTSSDVGAAPSRPEGVTSGQVESDPVRRAAGVRKRNPMIAVGFILAGIALVVAAFVGGPALLAPSTSPDGTGGRAGDEGDRPGRKRPRVPAAWSTFSIGDTGFVVSHPPEWEEISFGATQADLRDPVSGTYLRVEWTDRPGPSPEGAWETLSDSFGASHAGYDEIRIDPTTFKGYDAAEWEYTYSEGGTQLHAIDLGFVTGDLGFALNFQTHEEDWDASNRLWRTLKASFSDRA